MNFWNIKFIDSFWNKENSDENLLLLKEEKLSKNWISSDEWLKKWKNEIWFLNHLNFLFVCCWYLFFVSYFGEARRKNFLKLLFIYLWFFCLVSICLWKEGNFKNDNHFHLNETESIGMCWMCVCVCKKYLLKKYGIYNGCA